MRQSLPSIMLAVGLSLLGIPSAAQVPWVSCPQADSTLGLIAKKPQFYTYYDRLTDSLVLGGDKMEFSSGLYDSISLNLLLKSQGQRLNDSSRAFLALNTSRWGLKTVSPENGLLPDSVTLTLLLDDSLRTSVRAQRASTRLSDAPIIKGYVDQTFFGPIAEKDMLAIARASTVLVGVEGYRGQAGKKFIKAVADIYRVKLCTDFAAAQAAALQR